VLDWSNALVGDPAMELGGWPSTPAAGQRARLREGAGRLRGAGPVDSAAFWIYRLDAAVMLALLFSSEASHAALGPLAVHRLREVHERLLRELS